VQVRSKQTRKVWKQPTVARHAHLYQKHHALVNEGAHPYREEALEDAPVPPEHLLGACWREEAQVADLVKVEDVTDALQAADVSSWGAGSHRWLGRACNGYEQSDCVPCDCSASAWAQHMGG
jgi:hypothetical protein